MYTMPSRQAMPEPLIRTAPVFHGLGRESTRCCFSFSRSSAIKR